MFSAARSKWWPQEVREVAAALGRAEEAGPRSDANNGMTAVVLGFENLIFPSIVLSAGAIMAMMVFAIESVGRMLSGALKKKKGQGLKKDLNSQGGL